MLREGLHDKIVLCGRGISAYLAVKCQWIQRLNFEHKLQNKDTVKRIGLQQLKVLFTILYISVISVFVITELSFCLLLWFDMVSKLERFESKNFERCKISQIFISVEPLFIMSKIDSQKEAVTLLLLRQI